MGSGHFAIKGGEYCSFKLSASALVDYLDSHQITMDRFKAEIETYLIMVAGMMGTKPDDAFCPDLIWPRYGPDGFGFLTK